MPRAGLGFHAGWAQCQPGPPASRASFPGPGPSSWGPRCCAHRLLPRQHLRMMGAPPAASFLAWLLGNVAVMTLSSAALAAVLKASGIFAHSDALLVFLFLLDFGVSAVTLSYLLSALFGRAAAAGLCSSLLYLLSFLPYVVLLVLHSQLSPAAQTLLVSRPRRTNAQQANLPSAGKQGHGLRTSLCGSRRRGRPGLPPMRPRCGSGRGAGLRGAGSRESGRFSRDGLSRGDSGRSPASLRKRGLQFSALHVEIRGLPWWCRGQRQAIPWRLLNCPTLRGRPSLSATPASHPFKCTSWESVRIPSGLPSRPGETETLLTKPGRRRAARGGGSVPRAGREGP